MRRPRPRHDRDRRGRARLARVRRPSRAASSRAWGSARSSTPSPRELGLAGSVRNTGAGVEIEVEGAPDVAGELRPAGCAPTRRRSPVVDSVDAPSAAARAAAPNSSSTTPTAAAGGRTLVSPDIATCADCLAELADPGDRRYRHPFISCTNCGPRFTVVTGLPYDRPNTTMADLAAVRAVRGRVRRPGRPPLPRPDRRLPRLRADAAARPPGRGRRLTGADGGRRGAPAARRAARSSRSRASAATTSPATPRTRTRRRDAAQAQGPRRQAVRGDGRRPSRTREALAELGPAERALLTDPRRPVVLLPRRRGRAARAVGGPGPPRRRRACSRTRRCTICCSGCPATRPARGCW